jgi:large subunit ribosomal protein L6
VTVSREGDDRKTRSLHGLTRKLISNSVVGLSTGFTRRSRSSASGIAPR